MTPRDGWWAIGRIRADRGWPAYRSSWSPPRCRSTTAPRPRARDSTRSSPNRSTRRSSSHAHRALHGRRAGRTRPRPRLARVTPEELSAAIRTALTDAVAAGDLRVDVPAEVRVERPRNRDHGDWSTNVALQVAKGAGMPPRDVAASLAERLGRWPGSRRSTSPGPGSSTSPSTRRPPASSRARSWRRVLLTAATTPRPATSSTSSTSRPTRRVRCTWGTPGGPPSATPWAGCSTASGATVTTEYYLNDAGAQMDKFAQQRPRPGQGPADARGRLSRRVHRRPGRRGPRAAAGPARAARRRGARGRPRDRLPAAAGRHPGDADRLRRELRRVVLREVAARRRCRRAGGRPAAASRATSSTRTARSGCAPRTSPTTRTG